MFSNFDKLIVLLYFACAQRALINKEDFTAIETLGKMLGNTDVEGQVSQIAVTQKMLDDIIKEVCHERSRL